MAIRIPVKEESVDIRSGAGAVPTARASQATSGAFGADVAEAQGQIGKSVSRAGDVLAEHVIQQQKWKADRYTIETLDKIKGEVNAAMTDPSMQDVVDAKGNVVGKRQVGFLQRMNADAEGSTIESDGVFSSITKKYMDAAKGSPYVSQQLQQSITPYMRSVSEQVTSHESKQVRQAFTNTITKSIGNTVEEAAKFVSEDRGKNRFNMQRTLLAPGGIKAMVDKQIQFEGKGEEEAKALFRKYATEAIERSATTITLAQGPEAGREQLNFFNKYMDSKTFNEVSTRIDSVAKQQELKAARVLDIKLKLKEHEINDLAFRGLLSGARLEEEYKTGQVSEAQFNRLKDMTNSPARETGRTDSKTYYDLTEELMKPDVDPQDKISYLTAQATAGKLSPDDAIKLYNMHLVPSQKGMQSLRQSLQEGGFDKTAATFENNIRELDDKQHWVRTAWRKVSDHFSGLPAGEREKQVTLAMQNLSDVTSKKDMPPSQYPAVVDSYTASDNLKRHPAWTILPEKGRKGTDKNGNKVIVYPDGRVVRAE